jgi:GMP synthase-like glutamine amidotransferase
MTTHSAVLLDPTESLPRFDVGSRPIAPVARQPVLVAQPRHGRPAAALVDVLLAHGLDPAVVTADDESLPDPGASPLAILVGPDSLSEARVDGRLERELEWLRRADEAGTAVLGIGHGARALALAFGGSVTPAERPLRGWAMVDTVVPHVIPTGPWLAWQHDVITLPPDAVALAHNLLGPQAFRLGRHLGVQFHPEATPDDLAGWAGALDAPAEVRSLLGIVTRDPAAAADCTHRLLSSFIDSI